MWQRRLSSPDYCSISGRDVSKPGLKFHSVADLSRQVFYMVGSSPALVINQAGRIPIRWLISIRFSIQHLITKVPRNYSMTTSGQVEDTESSHLDTFLGTSKLSPQVCLEILDDRGWFETSAVSDLSRQYFQTGRECSDWCSHKVGTYPDSMTHREYELTR